MALVPMYAHPPPRLDLHQVPSPPLITPLKQRIPANPSGSPAAERNGAGHPPLLPTATKARSIPPPQDSFTPTPAHSVPPLRSSSLTRTAVFSVLSPCSPIDRRTPGRGLATGPASAPVACLPSQGGTLSQATVEVLGPNSRRVSASVQVPAPIIAVWSVLTDYYRLADYVPSLAKNEVLELRENGARLLQVGEQDVALGLKFQARVVVDVEEEPEQLLPCMSAWGGASAPSPLGSAEVGPTLGALLPGSPEAIGAPSAAGVLGDAAPAATAVAVEPEAAGFVRRRAIRFTMREGDFAAFAGRWILQEVQPQQPQDVRGRGLPTQLSYSVDVTPHFWLPVALVEGRIRSEIGANLASVAAEACKRASFAA